MNDELTQTEIDAMSYQTMLHIQKVVQYINSFITGLISRSEKHDQSKLEPPEAELFAKYTPRLSSLEYGSEEYQESLEALKPALEHHYANNRHHPEHFKNGLEDMNLLDIVEMFCDWKASSERQHGGNLRKSIEDAGKRFGMSPQLVKILENSIELFDK